MAKHEMFLAMVLANARRVEAHAVQLTVENANSRIDMLLLDGSSKPISAPPPDILLKIIEDLERGKRYFQANVFTANIEEVKVARGSTSMSAYVSHWKVDHCDDES